VDDLDGDLAETRPVRRQTRRQDVAEPAVDPHQGTLVVLQVQDHGELAEGARLPDNAELFMDEPRGTLRNDPDTDLAHRVPKTGPTFTDQALELPVAEVQTYFVAANLDDLEHPQFLHAP